MRAAAAAAILAAQASAPARAADPPPPRKCVIQQVAALRVQVVRDQAVLQGAIDGRPVRVLVDTGADLSLLIRDKARQLNSPLTNVPGLRVGVVGGVSQAQSTYVGQLQIAGFTKSRFRMLVAGEGRPKDFDVLLGEDVLGRYDIEFDLAHDTIRLLQPQGCGDGEMAYWAVTSYEEAPITDAHHDRVGVSVKLNGRPIRAVLDSGASASIATPPAAAAARVELSGGGIEGRGLGAQPLADAVGVLDTFTIGDETIRNAKLRFSDLFAATTFGETGSRVAEHDTDQPDMLLGFDFLKSHRVLVSRTHHMIYFTYEGGPVFDTSRPQAPAGAGAGLPGPGPAR